MEEYQEEEILWPESIQTPESFISWSNTIHFTPSPSNATLSSSSSSNSTCTQDELQAIELLCPRSRKNPYFPIVNSPKEIFCDEEWQEADVLWPDQESLKCNDFAFAWENSVGDEDCLTEGQPTMISSPIDIPKRKRNPFLHLL